MLFADWRERRGIGLRSNAIRYGGPGVYGKPEPASCTRISIERVQMEMMK
jgi:hypothetical protein